MDVLDIISFKYCGPSTIYEMRDLNTERLLVRTEIIILNNIIFRYAIINWSIGITLHFHSRITNDYRRTIGKN